MVGADEIVGALFELIDPLDRFSPLQLTGGIVEGDHGFVVIDDRRQGALQSINVAAPCDLHVEAPREPVSKLHLSKSRDGSEPLNVSSVSNRICDAGRHHRRPIRHWISLLSAELLNVSSVGSRLPDAGRSRCCKIRRGISLAVVASAGRGNHSKNDPHGKQWGAAHGGPLRVVEHRMPFNAV